MSNASNGRGRWVPVGVAAALAALGLAPVANLVSGAPYIPWWGAAVREWLVTGSAIVLVALGVARVVGERLDRWVGRVTAAVLAPSPRAFQAAAFVLVLALTAAFALYCFARAPFAQDEMAQRFHARILLDGRLFATGEPHPEFFSATGLLDRGGRWYSMYPMGGPAVLAAGMALHAVWLVNPVLTALTACALYRFAAAAVGEGAARASVLLFALSPFVLIMGGSEMNHGAALALATVALAALPAWATAGDGRTTAGAAALIGLAVGSMATVRPLDAAAVGAVIGLFQLSLLARPEQRGRARSLVVQIAAGALPVAWLLYANARTTGHPLLFAYEALYGPGHRLGFHPDPYGVPHTPAHALIVSSAYLMRLDRYLFEWPLPGLVPIVAGLVALRRPTRWDLLLVGLIAAILLAYALYWFDGFFAGPRFLYTALPAFLVVAARAPGLVAERLPRGTLRRAVPLVIPLCLLYAWTVPTGVSSVQLRAYYYHAGRTKLKTDIAAQVSAAGLNNALVFVHEGWRARLEARLRALGLTPGEAYGILSRGDACRIETALDAEDARAPADSAGRRERLLAATQPTGPEQPVAGLQADETILLTPGGVLTDACRREIAADSAGDTPYAPFLALSTFEPDGALGGAVVFARDLGARNELLRSRFSGRTWFRYRPRHSLADTTAAIVPY
jgi:4-amino-4-deoxy-L-arabinose transferase-like glycosyltransferase